MGKVYKALAKAGEKTEPAAGREPAESADRVPTKPPAMGNGAGLPAGQGGLEEGQPEWDERLIAATASSSMIAESFRKLRTMILHPKDGRPVKSLLITSAVPEEGKSFVCANLGITMAQGMEQHALLVDCDLRRPALAAVFGLGNERGLVNHLQDGVDLASLIRKSGFSKLSLLPGGTPPINPAELLDSGKMAALMAEVVSRYHDRFIILDSPPFSAAAETAVLAGQVDGVLLVVRWGVSRREHVKQVVDGIGREKIIGIVFNAFEATKLESKLQGYYHGYYDDYYARKYIGREP